MPECARIVAALRGQVPRVCECVTVPKPPPTPVGSRCHRRLSRCNPSAEAFRFQTANTGNRLYVMENVFRKLYCDPSANPRGGSFRMLHVVWWKREQKKSRAWSILPSTPRVGMERENLYTNGNSNEVVVRLHRRRPTSTRPRVGAKWQ